MNARLERRRQSERLAGLVGGLGSTQFWDNLKQAAHGLIAFDEMIVLSYRPDQRPECPYHQYDGERHRILIVDYIAGRYLLDPFYELALQSDVSGAFVVRDIAPDKFTSSRYFQTHFSLTQVQDELALVARPQADHCFVVSLFRTHRPDRYSRRETEFMQDQAPVLIALIERHLQMVQAVSRQAEPALTMADVFAGVSVALTRREIEIATLILRGHSSLSTALHLNIVEGTVKIHRKNIYKKLGISSQAELFSLFLAKMMESMVKS